MKNNIYENASERISYVGKIFKMGECQVKDELLKNMNPEWSKLHKDGYIHIHDLDAYGLTYNCLTFDILANFLIMSLKAIHNQEKLLLYLIILKILLQK